MLWHKYLNIKISNEQNIKISKEENIKISKYRDILIYIKISKYRDIFQNIDIYTIPAVSYTYQNINWSTGKLIIDILFTVFALI